MQPADLPAVARIADAVHADFPERPAVFAERLALFPAGCLFVDGGYAIAHPACLGAPPPLDTLLGTVPPGADSLHIHDVALLPARQGAGLGEAAVARFVALAAACRLPALSLVAVHGTARYWARFRFVPGAGADLRSYGDAAAYLVRRA